MSSLPKSSFIKYLLNTYDTMWNITEKLYAAFMLVKVLKQVGKEIIKLILENDKRSKVKIKTEWCDSIWDGAILYGGHWRSDICTEIWIMRSIRLRTQRLRISNKLDIFWGTERKPMFLTCSDLRGKVINEFGEVGHGKRFKFYSDIFNLCHLTFNLQIF